MSLTAKYSRPFALPALRVERLETALTEPRFVVTVEDIGRRFMVTPKLADVIVELQKGRSIEETAMALSDAWDQLITAKDLSQIIEQQMLPRGLAFPSNLLANRGDSLSQKRPLYRRLLVGNFRWYFLNERAVEKICSPLTILFEPLSVLLAVILIAASRWMLYTTIDWHFYSQITGQTSPAEYLMGLGLLIALVLFHEFGHAAAQLCYGLRSGPIGFQLYFYIPAFFANVDASWSLRPRRRIVVDIGGVYFQAVATSMIYLLYLNTNFASLLTVTLVSDTLCLITLNPFLQFDGYWLLADALAIPNLQSFSQKALTDTFKQLFNGPTATKVRRTLGGWRRAIILTYAVLRNSFFLLMSVAIFINAHNLYSKAVANISIFLSGCLRGLKTLDISLVVSSLLRLILFLFLLMTVSILLRAVVMKSFRLARAAVCKLFRQLTRREANHMAQG